MSISATNWSEREDAFTQTFYEQQQAQFWLSEEIPLANDILDWKSLSDEQRLCYTRASAGLNTMDTLQGEIGMPTLHRLVDGHQRKATLALYAAMENIHARAYSMANKVQLTVAEEREVFAWVEAQPRLQYKIRAIRDVYEGDLPLLEKMTASCILETALFYSGFFYPMYLAGQGKMIHMGEVFSLIIKDESAHGVYVGLLAREERDKLDPLNAESHAAWFREFAMDLYLNECAYADAIYADVGLTGEVKTFIRYNFNVCCDNLDLPRLFGDEEVNPVVLNGINSRNTTHDFFSSKGQSYQKITTSPLTDSMVEEAWNV